MKAYEGVDVKVRQSCLCDPGEYRAQTSVSTDDGKDKKSTTGNEPTCVSSIWGFNYYV
jgi:hypothetical protein